MKPRSSSSTDFLNNAISSLTELYFLLLNEEKALIDNNYDELIALTTEKLPIITKLKSLDDFEKYNRTDDSTFISTENITSTSDTNPFDDRLNELSELVSKIKIQNEINGLLLNQLLLRNSKLLSFFKGKTDSEIYGPDGLNTKNVASNHVKV